MSSTQTLEKSVFGRRLRQVRTQAGIPQYQLGILAGLEESSSSARISRYESGMYMPSPNFVSKLSVVLNVPAVYFYCADDRLANLILLYHQFPEKHRKALHKFANELVER
ncbi:helix-turn-helix domain-containing protein [Undibacterium sp. Di27W]|uniref:helix-turn-helix domain-containing protein n=1 Tax=Undibacterium sp. Di27W TaxID=3413036 RepID=UPI003BF42736